MTNTLAKQRRRFILISLAIPVALLVAFVVVPAADLIRMSFTNWDGLSIKSDFVGWTITFPCSTMPIYGSH